MVPSKVLHSQVHLAKKNDPAEIQKLDIKHTTAKGNL